MTLDRLRIENVRCIKAADLAFDARRNLICGPNGSGKTSLLEAIYLLGRARSFRGPRSVRLIRSGGEVLTVTADLTRGHTHSVLGVQFGRDGLKARLDARAVTGVAELATLFPVQAIDPQLHQLIEEGPQQRRRFLDWGVFHVEPSFVHSWQRYQRALRQRNAALRSRAQPELVRAWDDDLVSSGTQIAEARARYLKVLAPEVRSTGHRLLGKPIELQLSQGWAADRLLLEALECSWSRDNESGVTHVGPHRADLQIRMATDPARERASRGQQKLIAAAMLLGQLRCDAIMASPTAALLVDDPAAELDRVSLGRLLDEIMDLPVQLFVTALDHEHPALEPLQAPARFRVEHGELTRLV